MKRLIPILFISCYLLWIFMLFAKTFSIITWSWWIILAPIWLPFAFGSFCFFFIFIIFLGFLIYNIWRPEYR